MLTANDLTKIGKLVKSEINIEINASVPGIVKQVVAKELKPVKKDIKKIRRDLEFVVGSLDKDRWKLEQRVNKIDKHLGISTVVA